ncbi:MAG: N-acetylmuramoyl-L-alanine amidase [Clostridia bacterium]|nr:N-acetylmuramoyl-L-alanine amidase [Clostridia bacterium]
MKRFFTFFAAAMILLFSLGGDGLPAVAPPTDLPKTEETVLPVFQEEEPEIAPVYAGAEYDPLLPLLKYADPREEEPKFVMIHFTSAVALTPEDPYNMERIRSIFVENEVSTHYIVDREGTVTCYIPETMVAWHAGKGTWQENPLYENRMNQYAIGIEIAAMGSKEDMSLYLTPQEYDEIPPSQIGFTDAQYSALSQLVSDICYRHGIPMDREHIIGHEEYSLAKNDPGELFSWDRLLSSLSPQKNGN